MREQRVIRHDHMVQACTAIRVPRLRSRRPARRAASSPRDRTRLAGSARAPACPPFRHGANRSPRLDSRVAGQVPTQPAPPARRGLLHPNYARYREFDHSAGDTAASPHESGVAWSGIAPRPIVGRAPREHLGPAPGHLPPTPPGQVPGGLSRPGAPGDHHQPPPGCVARRVRSRITGPAAPRLPNRRRRRRPSAPRHGPITPACASQRSPRRPARTGKDR